MKVLHKQLQSYRAVLLRYLKPLLQFLAVMDARNVAMSAAAVSYYTLLAIFPAVAAGMAIVLFMVEPSQVKSVVSALAMYFPREITDLLAASLSRQAEQQGSNLLFAAIGIALALFGASGAMQGMMKALNTVYQVKETRSWLRLTGLSIALTLGVMIVSLGVGILLLCSYDQLVMWTLPQSFAVLIAVLRWPVMALSIHAMISLLFHYGANRATIAMQHITKGSIVAAVSWLLVTMLFFGYMQSFADFAQSYSVFAGIVALMMWFNFGSLSILIGALCDAKR